MSKHTPGPWSYLPPDDKRPFEDASMSKHTPGPWLYLPPDDKRPFAVVYAGEYADCGEPDLYCEVSSPEPEADGWLIAAAPEMLEALQAARQTLVTAIRAGLDGFSEAEGTIRKIDAALAKAMGEAGR